MRNKLIELLKGDCLELMKDIKPNSIDFILTDPPYGTTACKWDSVVPFEPMWEQIKRVRKDRAAVALFGSEPFSSALRISNIKEFKYDWIWDRVSPCGFLNSSFMPMKRHEIVSIFLEKGKPVYNKQMEKRSENSHSLGKKETYLKGKGRSIKNVYGEIKDKRIISYDKDFRNPTTIIEFSKGNNNPSFHPTQKPVELLEYLIKTYTNEGDTVLDFTMGSGSTGVACKNLNRNFIGIEQDENYFEIAKERINKA